MLVGQQQKGGGGGGGGSEGQLLQIKKTHAFVLKGLVLFSQRCNYVCAKIAHSYTLQPTLGKY